MSVQDAGARNAVEGHRAWGTLISEDYVVVHGLPLWLREDVNPEVLISPATPSRAGDGERLRIIRVDLLGLLDSSEVDLTGIRLSRPSGHPPVSSGEPGGSDRRLESADELRSAPEDVLGSPDGISVSETAELLRPVVRWEELQRLSLVEAFRMPELPTERIWICTVWGISWCRAARRP